MKINEIEKIQLEAAKIATGTTKLISINGLDKETGWDTLEKRRKETQTHIILQMSTDVSPSYLSSLMPQFVAQTVLLR